MKINVNNFTIVSDDGTVYSLYYMGAYLGCVWADDKTYYVPFTNSSYDNLSDALSELIKNTGKDIMDIVINKALVDVHNASKDIHHYNLKINKE